MTSRAVALLALLVAGSTGCASAATLQSARTLGRGRTQVALELGEQALVSRDMLRAYPVAGVAVRHGASDRVDVGLRLGPSGLEGQVKVQLTALAPGVAVSVAPLAAAYAWNAEDVEIRSYNAAVPVLVGFPFPTREGAHELVLGPRVHGHLFALGAGSAEGMLANVSAAATVGVLWRMPGTRPVRIATELGVLRPLVTHVDRSDGVGGTSFHAERWTLQANLAFLIGGP